MFFYANDDSVRAVGRWAALDTGLVTTAPGSKLQIAFRGEMIVLHFNLRGNEPTFPHLWLSLDEVCYFEATLEPYIRVCCGDGEHLLTVVFKGDQEAPNRWNPPLTGKVQFTGFDAQDHATLPTSTKKTIEFIGDSITEGVTVDAHYSLVPIGQTSRPYQDDALATYAALTAKALGLEAVFAGYGAVGATKSGQGNVPKAADMVPFCFAGQPVTYPPCDYILINHGTNDRRSPDQFPTEYIRLLDTVIERNPGSKIIVLTPFCGAFREELKTIVEEYNRRHGTDIFWVDTQGWIPPEPLHPTREGHKKAAERLVPILREHFGL